MFPIIGTIKFLLLILLFVLLHLSWSSRRSRCPTGELTPRHKTTDSTIWFTLKVLSALAILAFLVGFSALVVVFIE